ncbi:patatin-like phospholipase family protein [Pseudomonas nicosulfuronedens]
MNTTSENSPSHAAPSTNTPASDPAPTIAKKQIFLALQGGGAKGIVHVGGIRALDNQLLEIKGVSGTSAGSIVAALIAAGYKGKDLVDPDNRNHLLNVVGYRYNFHKPTDLFSKGGWRALRLIRSLANPKKAWAELSTTRRVIGALAISALGYLAYQYPVAALLTLIASIVLSTWRLLAGLTSVDKVRTLLDGVIAEKVCPGQTNITFRDLAKAGRIPLKIVATNAAGECLELFCMERTPDVVIADAVAASICLPIIFKPWSFSFIRETEHSSSLVEGKFLDGGLMSNLPAWPFDEERLLHPDALTVAIGIRSAMPSQSKQKHWLPSVVNAIVGGTGEIHTRATGKTIKIPLGTELGMLDFDADIERIYSEVRASELTVSTQLHSEIFENPRILSDAAEQIRQALTQLQNSYSGKWYSSDPKQRLRVAIGVQKAGAMNSLSLAFNAGYLPTDPDAGITLPLSGSLAGKAWTSRDPIVKFLGPVTASKLHAGHRINPDIQWVMCFPIIHPESRNTKIRPLVVVVDSSAALDPSLTDAVEFFQEFARLVFGAISKYDRDAKLTSLVQGANSWI